MIRQKKKGIHELNTVSFASDRHNSVGELYYEEEDDDDDEVEVSRVGHVSARTDRAKEKALKAQQEDLYAQMEDSNRFENTPLSLAGASMTKGIMETQSAQRFLKNTPSFKREKKGPKHWLFWTLSSCLMGFIAFLVFVVVMYNQSGRRGWGSNWTGEPATCNAAYCQGTTSWYTQSFFNLIYESPANDFNEIIFQTWLNTSADGKNQSYTFLQISTTKSQNMTMIIGSPAAESPEDVFPVVILIHGTREDAMQTYQAGFMQTFVSYGFICISIDQRYHGNRTTGVNHYDLATGPYFDALLKAWTDGRTYPYAYDSAFDVIRLLDYLNESRVDIDWNKVGITGISSGGTIAWRAASADLRITHVAPIIGVEYTRENLANNVWQDRIWSIRPPFLQAAMDLEGIDTTTFNSKDNLSLIDPDTIAQTWARINPGILDDYDSPLGLSAISPRPLFILVAADDIRNGALSYVMDVIDTAMTQYSSDGADGNLQVHVQPNQGHGLWPGVMGQVACFFNSSFARDQE